MLNVEKICKQYSGKEILNNVSFKVEAGELVVVLGPSGTGKSTLLSVIAGLSNPNRGSVYLDGINLTDVPTHNRGITLLTQKANLFPFTTVLGNVSFSPKMKSLSKKNQKLSVAKMLDLVGLPGFEDRDPESLSGGEQQRVALARALCSEPRALLLDEPFSSLDQSIRLELQSMLKQLVQTSQLPVIFVTHQLEEAMSLATRVVILDGGNMYCNHSPEELFQHPPNITSARLLGFNVLRLDTIQWVNELRLPEGDFVCVRPESLVVNDDEPQLLGKIKSSNFVGSHYRVELVLQDGQQLFLLVESGLITPEYLKKISVGQTLGFMSKSWQVVSKGHLNES